MKNSFKIIMTLVLATMGITALSAIAGENSTQVGRYLTMPNKPTSTQINLLDQIIQIRFPQEISTVGEAMNYILRFSGYSMVSENNMQLEVKNTLDKPLPLIDREIGPVKLKDALSVLAGTAFHLSHDPVNRTINFKIKSQYAQLSKRVRK